MGLDPAPFDVVEASRRVWLDRWDESAASGMAVFTGILRSFQLLKEQVDIVMQRHGLTFPRYEVLAWLATRDEPSVTLSWISRTLRMPPATLTNVIDHLEGKQLVRRVPHSSDARTTLAVATARGRRLERVVTQELNDEVYRRIAVPEADRIRLIELLHQLRANGNEFDIERSDEVIANLQSRRV
jgi:DNA-binding MarR family transcriptional regulator